MILVGFYLLIFSLIPHKEPRFLLPVVPLCFLLLGQFLATLIKSSTPKWRKLLKVYLGIAIFVEIGMTLFFLNFHFRNWEPLAYLQAKEAAPQSIYTLPSIDAPYYTWTHRHRYVDQEGNTMNRTVVYRGNKNPTYARRKQGVAIPTLHDHEFNMCFDLIVDLQEEKIRPEYVILSDFTCAHSFYCQDVCFKKFESLGLYELEKTFWADLEPRKNEPLILYRRKRYLYRIKP